MTSTYTHCPYCGDAFGKHESWPRACAGCGESLYRNPTPVAVLLQPVDDGMLTIRRAIEPEQGELALPGGFMDMGESWEEAAAREVREETGLEVNPGSIDVFDVESAPDGTLLVFGEAPAMRTEALPPFNPDEEADERIVVEQPRDLAFPLHTQVLADWFEPRDT